MKNLNFFTRPLLFPIVMTAILFLIGCDDLKKGAPSLSSAEVATKPSAENVLVVVQDQSASVEYSENERASNEKWLKKFLYNEIAPSTDLVILNIGDYARSASFVNHKKITWKFTEMKDDSFKTDADRELEQNSKQMQERSQLKQMQKQLLDILVSSSELKSNTSAVLEVLPQLAEQIKSYKHAKVLFLSDLCEFSDLRDFENHPPLNLGQATQMANTDYQKLLKEYSVLKDAWISVERIDVLIPQNTPKHRTVIIPKYWNALFQKHLGYQHEVYWSTP